MRFMPFGASRALEKMVKLQLAGRDIKDPDVLAAMTKVPRHVFVDKELHDQAYDDKPLPIGHDQTISQPYMVALMAASLQLKGDERILEVGTGSGYAAAILGELCGHVYSVECIESLAIKAQTILQGLGYRNVSVLVGDGTLGWEQHAPYDAIVISAAAPCIPRPLIEQLKSGGYLLMPMGEPELQILVRIRKDEQELEEEYLGECTFVKLRGEYGWRD